ncbi:MULTISPECIES: hypothetical protein [Proteiniphilum]|jgi:hypothetical protein|uniref:DUF3876 domain-containing protein n=1 Tax=Proteiniphilum TaxID=294702 RepID=UPI00092791A6|nr:MULTISPECIES: hypothetical protein [Proteiniphilum]MDY9917465.1 hypothetical protein [Proteiniphilum sp.]OJV85840.1 MAG: hypothetical protein BGO34_02700 [Bacteroidia bacterium 44-10]
MNTKGDPINNGFPARLQGGWESVDGNPDIYIFRDYDGNYSLLAYSYDTECRRGGFSCHAVEPDEDSYYIRMGIKRCRLTEEKSPYGLHIAGWGSYMKN